MIFEEELVSENAEEEENIEETAEEEENTEDVVAEEDEPAETEDNGYGEEAAEEEEEEDEAKDEEVFEPLEPRADILPMEAPSNAYLIHPISSNPLQNFYLRDDQYPDDEDLDNAEDQTNDFDRDTVIYILYLHSVMIPKVPIYQRERECFETISYPF